MSQLDRLTEQAPFSYDGRSYLRTATDSTSGDLTEPLYDSAGLLHALRRVNGSTEERITYLHFAGRPVAQLKTDAAGSALTWLTTDHLGTPVLATDDAGAEVWAANYSPFGRDLDEGLPGGALENEIYLRFPGQWDDGRWEGADLGAEVFCNVHRWYLTDNGRYSRTDPLGRDGDPHPYLYALGNPLSFFDLLGLKVRVCCKAIPPTLHGSIFINIRFGANTNYKRHCYFEFGDGSTVGLHGPTSVLGVLGAIGCQAQGEIQRRQLGQGGFDQRIDLPTNCGPWSECADDCVNEGVANYPNPSKYCLFGPNSNSFTGSIERQCPVKPPPPSEIRNAPGWFDGP